MKYHYNLLFFVFFSFLISDVNATHVSGGDITYTCIGPNQYKIQLKLYMDCGGGSSMPNTVPIIFTNSCGFANPALTLNLQDPLTGTNCTGTYINCGTEVSQLCPSQRASSTCHIGGALPGMKEFIYRGTINLPGGCNIWTLDYDLAVRNVSSNVTGMDPFHVQTTMNTALQACNNSPVFTAAQPIPYVCANQPVSYNFGVIETDGDSMTFSLVNAMRSASASVTYYPPYSGSQPIAGITIDPATGQINFTPLVLGNFIVVIQAREYRNGILIGSVMRDIQFIVQNCQINNVPDATGGQITNLTGGAVQTGPYALQLCEGSSFTFNASYTDSDFMDTLSLTTNITSVLQGATFSTSGTNPLTGTFSWTAIDGSSGNNNSFTVTVQDNACPVSGTQTYVYNINVLPRTIAGPDTTLICGLQQAQLNAAGGTVFNWYDMSGNLVATGPQFSCNPCSNPLAQPLVTTSYVVVSNLNNTCVDRDTVTVTVAPDFNYSLSPGSFCWGQSVQLNVVTSPPGAYTYSWTPSAYLNDTSIADPLATVPVPGNYNYYVNIANSFGCLKTDSISIDVSSSYTPSITAIADTVCFGDSTQLNVIFAGSAVPATCGITSLACSGSLGTAILGNGIASNSGTGYPAPYGNGFWGARHQILYRATELQAMGFNGGKITNLAFDVASMNSSTSSYANFQIRMKCTSATQLSTATGFETGMATVFPAQNITVTTGWNIHNFAFAFKWDGISNVIVEICFNNSSFIENASTRHTPTGFNSVLWYSGNNSTVCSNGLPTASANRPNIKFNYCAPANPDNYTYQWSPGATLSDSTIQDPRALSPVNATYNVIVTDIVGGCSDTASVTVQTSTGPANATINHAGPFCETSNPVTLTAATGGGVWSGPGITNASTGIFNPGVAGTGAHIITYTISNNCANFDTDTIIVNPAPAAEISPQGPFCSNDPAIFFDAVPTGGTWSSSPNPAAIDPLTGLFDPALAAENNNIIYTTGGTCPNTDTIMVTNVILPPPGIILPSAVCEGEAIGNIIATGVAGSTFNWYLNPSLTEYIYTGDNFNPAATASASYYVTQTLSGCTSKASTASITFYPLPNVSFTPTAVAGAIPFTVNFTNTSGSDVTGFHWDFGNNATSELINPSNTYDQNGVYSVLLTGRNIHSCLDTAQGTVIIESELSNVFTPNGDDQNDIFMIPYSGVTDFHAVIFNRWGGKVYEWDIPTEGWDGGNSQDGTYYYVMKAIDMQGNLINKSGHVTLLR